MSSFIEVTKSKNGATSVVVINLQYVRSAEPTSEGGTKLHFSDSNEEMLVVEPYRAVIEKIESAHAA